MDSRSPRKEVIITTLQSKIVEKVQDIINHNVELWDLKKIEALIVENENVAILCTQIDPTKLKGQLIWMPNSKSQFSIKSTYNLLTTCNDPKFHDLI